MLNEGKSCALLSRYTSKLRDLMITIIVTTRCGPGMTYFFWGGEGGGVNLPPKKVSLR